MTREIQFIVSEENGPYELEKVRSDELEGFIRTGIREYDEYLLAKEDASREGSNIEDLPANKDLVEKYLSENLTSFFLNGEKPDSRYVRWSELGKVRGKVMDALSDDNTESIDELDVFNKDCIYYGEFFDNLRVCVEEI